MTSTDHRYAHQIDPNGGSAAARLARMIGPGRRVLELGTGPGTVTRLLHAQGCRVTGVELDAEAIALCRPFCERIVQADLSRDDWLALVRDERFDTIVLADVLEHLPQPQVLLEQLQALLVPGGQLAISLPNASHLSVVGSLLGGRFPYQDKGLLDRTHLRFFGRRDIEGLLQASGYLWGRWECVEVAPEQAELQAYWHRLDTAQREFLQQQVTDGQVYQHVLLAYASTEAGQLARLEAELTTQQDATRQAQQTLAETVAELANLQTAHARQAEALAQTEARLRETLGSRSWRITAPLRWLTGWLR